MQKRQPPFGKTPRDTGAAAPLDSVSTDALLGLIESWLDAGEMRCHTPRTLESRADRLKMLIWFLEHRDLKICGLAELRAFFQYLRNGHKEQGGRFGNSRLTKPLSSGTVKTYYSTLRAFFNWLVKQEEIELSPMRKIEPPVDRPDQIRPFTPDDVQLLYKAAEQTLHPLRDKAILSVLLDTGIRATELCQLKVSDVDLNGKEMTVHGKGNKDRRVPFSAGTRRALMQYLNAEAREPHEALFISDRGKVAGDPLTRHGLRFLIRRLGQRAGIVSARTSPHTFRHTFAIFSLRNGAPGFIIKEMLGHESLVMTNRYTNIANADISAFHREFSPVENMNRRKR